MKEAPKVGERVRYTIVFGEGERWEETRTCTGVVTKRYPKYDDVFDDDGEFVRKGPLLPESHWKVCIKVDMRPKWWPYTNSDEFCPEVSEVERIGRAKPSPIGKKKAAALSALNKGMSEAFFGK